MSILDQGSISNNTNQLLKEITILIIKPKYRKYIKVRTMHNTSKIIYINEVHNPEIEPINPTKQLEQDQELYILYYQINKI